MGTSLVLVNSKKGNAIFSSVADKMNYKKVDINQAILQLHNPSAVKSAGYNPKRNKFFQKLCGGADIIQLIAKYTKVSFSRKVYMKVRGLLLRIKEKILG